MTTSKQREARVNSGRKAARDHNPKSYNGKRAKERAAKERKTRMSEYLKGRQVRLEADLQDTVSRIRHDSLKGKLR